jgi:hypothetical protein
MDINELQKIFPVGCRVELVDVSYLWASTVLKTGSIGMVVGHRIHLGRIFDSFLIVEWDVNGGRTDCAPWRFKKVGEVVSVDLKTANSVSSATNCISCGGQLKEPYPGLKHCPKCEP